MKLALHKAFRQVGASQQDADDAAESIDSAMEKRMNDKQSHLAKNSDMYTVRTEMAELKSQIAGVRSEVGMVRAELRQEIALVRGEIVTVRAELKQDIASVRGDIASVRGEMAHMRSELIRWIVGGQIATIFAMVGLIKFVHP
ncbi:hypothetical protein ACQ86G_27890 [Roseateles chitinivorans]|uniref:hypothetical protein n=1 Tax=Roseateles chitinivorans TaxID=2917965 RepID=UPI003D67B458